MCDRSSDPTEHDAARERPSALDDHPSEPHEFDVHCKRCGKPGMVNLSIITPDETVTIARLTEPDAGGGRTFSVGTETLTAAEAYESVVHSHLTEAGWRYPDCRGCDILSALDAARERPSALDVWDTDLTYAETTRLARAISQADHVNWPSRVVAEKIAGTVRAIAAARLAEPNAGEGPSALDDSEERLAQTLVAIRELVDEAMVGRLLAGKQSLPARLTEADAGGGPE